jgi:hypothetical protein
MKKLLILLLIISFNFSNATTYYISTTGNDATGNGSFGNPWKTLFKATSMVTTPGNIIHVNAGTYNETQMSSVAVGVSIEGDGVTSILRATYSTIFIPIFEAYSNTEGTVGNQKFSNLKFDGRGATSWAVQIQGRSKDTIENCTFVNFTQRGVVWGGVGSNGDYEPAIYATGNVFRNNTMTNCSSFDGTHGYGCINIGGQRGMLVYGNTIINNNIANGGYSNTPGWPIKLWNDGYVDSLQIYNNYLERPPFPYAQDFDFGYFGFCIEFFNQRGLHIYNNTIKGSVDLNYQTKGPYAYSLWMHNNTIGRDTTAAHGETGLWLEYQTEDAIIENNTFRNVSQALAFSLRPDVGMNFIRNITFQKNLCYNIGKTDGTRQGGGIIILMNDNSDNYTSQGYFNIYNNTFTAASGTAAPYIGLELPGGKGATNVRVRNNLVQGFYDWAIESEQGNKISGASITNNDIYLNGVSGGSPNTFNWIGGNPTSSTLTPNITVAPNLNAFYQPNTGSPLLNAGVNVGLPYYGSAPNIGFWQTPDATPPTVTSTTPAPNITGVSINVRPTITFSTTLNPATVTTGNITLKRGITPVTINVSYSSGVVTITPTSDLLNNTLYTVNITTGVTDSDGVAMASPFTFNFTTANAGNIIKRNYLIVPKRN